MRRNQAEAVLPDAVSDVSVAPNMTINRVMPKNGRDNSGNPELSPPSISDNRDNRNDYRFEKIVARQASPICSVETNEPQCAEFPAVFHSTKSLVCHEENLLPYSSGLSASYDGKRIRLRHAPKR